MLCNQKKKIKKKQANIQQPALCASVSATFVCVTVANKRDPGEMALYCV